MSKYYGILTRNGVLYNKKDIKESDLKSIKTELTVKPNTFNSDDNQQFSLYKETEDTIIVPRYYGIKKFGSPKFSINSKEVSFKFNSTPRDYQIPVIEKCVEHIKKNGGGLLSVPCAFGKTVVAIKIASDLGLKTLVIVHKTFLQDQWIQRIRQFTDATIGIIRQNQVGVIEYTDKGMKINKKKGIRTCDIVIGTIQSISMKDYDPEIFDDFGFVIYDEAHHVASRVFSQALFKTGAKYTFALSATPFREDGLTKVMLWYIGDIIYRVARKINKHVQAKIFHYYTNNKYFIEKTAYIKDLGIKPSVPKMTSNLCRLKERTFHIVNIINHLRKFQERKIIILSKMVDHLELLKKLVDEKIQYDIDNNILEEGEIKTKLYVGKLKKHEREDAEINGDIIFGTYELAKEGLDIERLNTIILATPMKNVIQSVGRIMRKVLKHGDTRPLIIDFTDQLSVFINQSRIREKQYSKSKYEIQHYYLLGDKISSEFEFTKTFNNLDKDEDVYSVLGKKKIDKTKLSLEQILDINKVIEEEENDIINKLGLTTNNNDNDICDSEDSEDSKSIISTESEEEIIIKKAKPTKPVLSNKTVFSNFAFNSDSEEDNKEVKAPVYTKSKKIKIVNRKIDFTKNAFDSDSE